MQLVTKLLSEFNHQKCTESFDELTNLDVSLGLACYVLELKPTSVGNVLKMRKKPFELLIFFERSLVEMHMYLLLDSKK